MTWSADLDGATCGAGAAPAEQAEQAEQAERLVTAVDVLEEQPDDVAEAGQLLAEPGPLDEIELRLALAESGDLAALEGWTAPSASLAPEDAERAAELLVRHRALAVRLREEQRAVAAAAAALRRSSALTADRAAPVYLDRAG